PRVPRRPPARAVGPPEEGRGGGGRAARGRDGGEAYVRGDSPLPSPAPDPRGRRRASRARRLPDRGPGADRGPDGRRDGGPSRRGRRRAHHLRPGQGGGPGDGDRGGPARPEDGREAGSLVASAREAASPRETFPLAAAGRAPLILPPTCGPFVAPPCWDLPSFSSRSRSSCSVPNASSYP